MNVKYASTIDTSFYVSISLKLKNSAVENNKIANKIKF